MPGAFDELLAGPASGGPGNLTPEQLQGVLAYRNDPRFSVPTTSIGGSSYWYDPNKTYDAATDTHGFMLTRQHGWRRVGEGDASSEIADPTQDQDVIMRLRAGTAGKLGDRWDTKGNYLGTYEAQDGGGRGFNQAALMFGAALGGNLYMANGGGVAAGATGAGMTASEQAALMAANGMTDAEIAAALAANGNTAGAASLTGTGLGGVTGAPTTTALGADALAVPNTTTAATANLGTIPTTTAAAGAAASAGGLSTWQQVVGLGKDLGLDAKGIAGLLIAKGLAKDVPPSVADPNLVKAINDANDINDKAQNRAEANDALWQREFMPRYLDQMDAMARDGRRLTDFNMGLAQKYDKRYWDTTARQQDKFYAMVDAYDSDANRDQLVGKAGATADFNNQGALDALGRNMRGMGVNPMSGKYASQIGRAGMQGALNKTLAMNTAREAARKEGLNMRAVAAGLGGNLSGASAGFAGQATGASGLGMAGIQGAQGGFNSNDQNWRANMGLAGNMAQMTGGWGMGLTGFNNQANIMNTQGYNQLLGYGLGMFTGRKG